MHRKLYAHAMAVSARVMADGRNVLSAKRDL